VNALRLASSRDGGHLELRHRGPERWEAKLTLPGLTATAEVDSFSHNGEHTLGILFRRLSDDWRGWDGERTWTSIEGGLDLAASHDGLGHVALRVRVRSGLYGDAWTARGVIWLDAGQLGRVAREVAAFEASR
jgi:hypothetical protein